MVQRIGYSFFEILHAIRNRESLGDWSDVGTPGYIPNPVVKDVSADGTWRATSWESRSLPRDSFYLINLTVS